MALSKEQVKEIKTQINEQIKHLPKEQQEQWEKQIESMSPEELEAFVKQQTAAAQKDSQQEQPIFRSIISGQIPSKKLDENKQAIAVLSTKSISKGHTIIIPKQAVTDSKQVPTSAFTLAKKIAKKISSKLKTKGTEIQTEFVFGEIIIHVIPIYDKTLNINSPRTDVPEEELNELEKKLKKIEKPKTIRIKRKKQSNTIKLKRRIP